MRLPAFEYHAPTELDEVFGLLSRFGAAAELMGGGTDLLPGLKSGKRTCEHVIALKGVPELSGISFDERAGLTIGANAIVADVARHPAVREHYPVLAQAIHTLATVQVRNKATVAGNLCNASPCADTATPLMALGAKVRLVGASTRRDLLLEDFFLGPRQTAREEDEVLQCVQIPVPPPELRAVFLKFSPRSRVDIAAVNLTLAMTVTENCIERAELCLGTVAPTPMRAVNAERVLEGEAASNELFERAAEAARDECRPITDFRATAEYKRHLVYVLSRRALETLTEVTR